MSWWLWMACSLFVASPCAVTGPAELFVDLRVPLDDDGALCIRQDGVLTVSHHGGNVHGIADRYQLHFASHGFTVDARGDEQLDIEGPPGRFEFRFTGRPEHVDVAIRQR